MGIYNKYLLPVMVDSVCSHNLFVQQRQAIVPLATGRVVEIGAGSGLNLPFYHPDRVTEVITIEPSQELWNRNRIDLEKLNFAVKYFPVKAESLPLEDHGFDTIVSTFTLCTIRDLTKAFAEMRRILKPDGTLLFCEHGLAPDPAVQKWQFRINPAWKQVSGGCNLNRDIPQLLRDHGFKIQSMQTKYLPGWKIATYNYCGSAVLG